MTTNSSTKQSIASSIASLALNPAQALGNNIAKMMDTPDIPSVSIAKKWQISQSLDQYETAIIESKKHIKG